MNGFQVSISKEVASKTSSPKRQSWWVIETRERAAFYAKVEQEQATIRQTKFGQLGTIGTDSLSGGRPR